MLNQEITGILHEANEKILRAIQEAATPTDAWVSVIDEHGNENLPDDERRVLTFECGDRCPGDPRPSNAAYGMGFGWFDQDKRYWRVHGRISRYVTHWREEPLPPKVPGRP